MGDLARHCRQGSAAGGFPIRQRTHAWLGLLVLLLVTAFLSPSSSRAAGGDPAPKEYEIKGQFVTRFAHFVIWPATVFPAPNSPLTIGTLGREPFQQFRAAIERRNVNGHPLVLKMVKTPADAAECQVLVIGASEARRAKHFLHTLRESPVLTIGESDEFLKQGGIINFVLQPDQTLSFEINIEAARRAGIEIRSQLLRNARSVVRE